MRTDQKRTFRTYAELVLVLAVVLGAMALSQHMDTEASQEEANALNSRDWAGQQVCGADRTPVWDDDKTLRCLRNLNQPQHMAATKP